MAKISTQKAQSKASKALIEKDFSKASLLYKKYFNSEHRMDALLGYAYCQVHLQNFKELTGLLQTVTTEGTYRFQKIVTILLAHCYHQLQMNNDANRWFEAYTELVVADNNEDSFHPWHQFERYEGQELLLIEAEFMDEENFGDEEDFDEEEEDDYDRTEDNIAYFDSELIPAYQGYINLHNHYLLKFPSIMHGWADYLQHNPQWLDIKQKQKKSIANRLVEFGDAAWSRDYLLNSDIGNNNAVYFSLGQRLYGMAVHFNPVKASRVLCREAELQLRVNKKAAIGSYKKILLHYPDHVLCLHQLATIFFEEKDYDGAISCIDKSMYIHNKNAWTKKVKLRLLANEIYQQSAWHYFDNGNIEKGATTIMKYLREAEPKVYTYVTREGMEPDDLWIVLAEGYMKNAFLSDDQTQADRRSLMFAELAIAANGSLRGHTCKAQLFSNMQRYEEAMTSIEAAYKIEPGYYHLHYVKALILAGSKAPEKEILAAIRKTLKLNPSFASALRQEPAFNAFNNTAAFKALFK